MFPQVTNLLNELEFVIVPFVNPDGYEVSKYSVLLTCNDKYMYTLVVYLD